MRHAGVDGLARLDIDTRRIIFKAIDRFAEWCLRAGVWCELCLVSPSRLSFI